MFLCNSKLEADKTSDILSQAIDLEVIILHSQVPSETIGTRDGFRQMLAMRDGERCVWSGMPPGVGMHIIPWSKGDEWLQLIIGNRPHGDERRLHTLTSVNDIRNGIMSSSNLHTYFDSRAAVVLKACLHLFSGQPPYTSLSDTQSYPRSGRCSSATYPHSSRP